MLDTITPGITTSKCHIGGSGLGLWLVEGAFVVAFVVPRLVTFKTGNVRLVLGCWLGKSGSIGGRGGSLLHKCCSRGGASVGPWIVGRRLGTLSLSLPVF